MPTLDGGRYGLSAEAYVAGQPLADACVEVTLPTSRPIALSLASSACGLSEPVSDTGGDGLDGAVPADNPDGIEPNPRRHDAGGEPEAAPDAVEPDAAPDPCDGPDASSISCSPCGRACTPSELCVDGVCAPRDADSARCTPHERGGHAYLVCSEPMAWVFARQRCAAWGYGLVVIDDADENTFLSRVANGAELWTAANDLGPSDVGVDGLDIQLTDIRLGSAPANCRLVDGTPGEGHWFWADPGSKQSNGKPLCTMGAEPSAGCVASGGAFVRFAHAQPDNTGCTCLIGCLAGEDCGVLRGATGEWADASCAAAFGFVCERALPDAP